MKKIVPILFLLVPAAAVQAQLISRFTWETSNPLQATYGPNASSISSVAYGSAGGADGTHGLNAGTPTHDIDMILTGSYYTLPGLDISVAFLRKESQASFFTLGNLDFGMNGGSIYLKFALIKGPGDTLINVSNLYTVPSDNAFHTYRFIYNNVTGLTTVAVDGTTVYTYQSTVGAALYWTGAGNATVGSLMDGTGSNVAILDNLIIQNPATTVVLPLELLSFDATAAGRFTSLIWTTTHEINVRDFTVERSVDGVQYQPAGVVAAQQNYSGNNDYRFTDSFPASGTNFYRLKMEDLDGNFSYSPIKKIDFSATVTISCYPNPVVDYVNVRIYHSDAAEYRYTIVTLDGKMIQSGLIAVSSSLQQVSLNVTAAPKGLVLIRVQNVQDHSSETFKIFKQ
jgi:Secretion system C-terminal sorting domain